MAYRSDLEAALARLDALGPRHPCPTCLARSKRLRRVAMFFLGAFLFVVAFAILAFASLAGFAAIALLLIAATILFARGEAAAAPFAAGLIFALLSAVCFAAFVWLERLLSFDVGNFG